ncbi:hypothetical protein [Micromonospora chalcea]|uniref:hypothetical protein n=1 Tax=Micromonospora chalcea TaxID=1874 RepID=UPI00157DE5E8|nr:hypothetical protein [Micromonospora chalcea]
MITAWVAIAAAVFAYQQVKHARRLREDQAQPFVVVSLKPSPVWANAINLVVENIGNTLARDVLLSFDRPIESKARTGDINESTLLKEGVRVMPPGMKFETLFDLSHVRKDSGLPMQYVARASFFGPRSSGRAKRETLEFVLDMNVFYGLEGFRESGLHEAARSLRDIRKIMAGWTRRQRLGVSVSDEDYYEWAEDWQYSKSGRFPSLERPIPAGRRTPTVYDYLDDAPKPHWRPSSSSAALVRRRRA